MKMGYIIVKGLRGANWKLRTLYLMKTGLKKWLQSAKRAKIKNNWWNVEQTDFSGSVGRNGEEYV